MTSMMMVSDDSLSLREVMQRPSDQEEMELLLDEYNKYCIGKLRDTSSSDEEEEDMAAASATGEGGSEEAAWMAFLRVSVPNYFNPRVLSRTRWSKIWVLPGSCLSAAVYVQQQRRLGLLPEVDDDVDLAESRAWPDADAGFTVPRHLIHARTEEIQPVPHPSVAAFSLPQKVLAVWKEQPRRLLSESRYGGHTALEPSDRDRDHSGRRSTPVSRLATPPDATGLLYWPAFVTAVVGVLEDPLFDGSAASDAALQRMESFDTIRTLALQSAMHLAVDVVFCVDEVSCAQRLTVAPNVIYPGTQDGTSAGAAPGTGDSLRATGAPRQCTPATAGGERESGSDGGRRQDNGGAGAPLPPSSSSPGVVAGPRAGAGGAAGSEEEADDPEIVNAVQQLHRRSTSSPVTKASQCPLLLPEAIPSVVSIRNYSCTTGTRKRRGSGMSFSGDFRGSHDTAVDGAASQRSTGVVLPSALSVASMHHGGAKPFSAFAGPGLTSPQAASTTAAAAGTPVAVTGKAKLNKNTLSNSPISLMEMLCGPVCQAGQFVFLRPTSKTALVAQRDAVEALRIRWERLRRELTETLYATEVQLPSLASTEVQLPRLVAHEDDLRRLTGRGVHLPRLLAYEEELPRLRASVEVPPRLVASYEVPPPLRAFHQEMPRLFATASCPAYTSPFIIREEDVAPGIDSGLIAHAQPPTDYPPEEWEAQRRVPQLQGHQAGPLLYQPSPLVLPGVGAATKHCSRDPNYTQRRAPSAELADVNLSTPLRSRSVASVMLPPLVSSVRPVAPLRSRSMATFSDLDRCISDVLVVAPVAVGLRPTTAVVEYAADPQRSPWTEKSNDPMLALRAARDRLNDTLRRRRDLNQPAKQLFLPRPDTGTHNRPADAGAAAPGPSEHRVVPPIRYGSFRDNRDVNAAATVAAPRSNRSPSQAASLGEIPGGESSAVGTPARRSKRRADSGPMVVSPSPRPLSAATAPGERQPYDKNGIVYPAMCTCKPTADGVSVTASGQRCPHAEELRCSTSQIAVHFYMKQAAEREAARRSRSASSRHTPTSAMGHVVAPGQRYANSVSRDVSQSDWRFPPGDRQGSVPRGPTTPTTAFVDGGSDASSSTNPQPTPQHLAVEPTPRPMPRVGEPFERGMSPHPPASYFTEGNDGDDTIGARRGWDAPPTQGRYAVNYDDDADSSLHFSASYVSAQAMSGRDSAGFKPTNHAGPHGEPVPVPLGTSQVTAPSAAPHLARPNYVFYAAKPLHPPVTPSWRADDHDFGDASRSSTAATDDPTGSVDSDDDDEPVLFREERYAPPTSALPTELRQRHPRRRRPREAGQAEPPEPHPKPSSVQDPSVRAASEGCGVKAQPSVHPVSTSVAHPSASPPRVFFGAPTSQRTDPRLSTQMSAAPRRAGTAASRPNRESGHRTATHTAKLGNDRVPTPPPCAPTNLSTRSEVLASSHSSIMKESMQSMSATGSVSSRQGAEAAENHGRSNGVAARATPWAHAATTDTAASAEAVEVSLTSAPAMKVAAPPKQSAAPPRRGSVGRSCNAPAVSTHGGAPSTIRDDPYGTG